MPIELQLVHSSECSQVSLLLHFVPNHKELEYPCVRRYPLGLLTRRRGIDTLGAMTLGFGDRSEGMGPSSSSLSEGAISGRYSWLSSTGSCI